MADIDDFDDEEERKRRSAASAPEFTYDTIAADVWTAVYYGIPLGAGPDLLRHAHGAAMQCAGAVAGPPGLSMHAFEPMQGELGADKSREENFEHAVRRLDELNSRLRPAMLDDEAERQAPQQQQPAAEKEPAPEVIERETQATATRDLPPDPEGMNDDRAKWADSAVRYFQFTTGTDREDAVSDLLCDLMHFADRQGLDFGAELDRARMHYDAETMGEQEEVELTRPEPLTLEAIQRDPWNAVKLDLPDDANPELRGEVYWTAHWAEREAMERHEFADTREDAKHWLDLSIQAQRRMDQTNFLTGGDKSEIAPAPEPATEKEQIDPWIMAASADLSLSNDAQHAGSQLFQEFDRLDWWHDYSDDYTVRVRERERMDEAKTDLAAYALTSPDHAVLASRIFDKTSPPEFSGPRADWYVPTGELDMIEIEERASEIVARPLGAAELAERVRRIIEDPSLADAERDDRVLQVVEERREEQSQAEAVRQDDAPQVDSSQEPETQSTADRDAAEVDWLFGREEMTEARAAAYDRFTGQELSSRTGQSAGQVQEAGQSQSHSKGRSR